MQDLSDRIRAVTGVTAVGATSNFPLQGHDGEFAHSCSSMARRVDPVASRRAARHASSVRATSPRSGTGDPPGPRLRARRSPKHANRGHRQPDVREAVRARNRDPIPAPVLRRLSGPRSEDREVDRDRRGRRHPAEDRGGRGRPAFYVQQVILVVPPRQSVVMSTRTADPICPGAGAALAAEGLRHRSCSRGPDGADDRRVDAQPAGVGDDADDDLRRDGAGAGRGGHLRRHRVRRGEQRRGEVATRMALRVDAMCSG